MSNIVRHLCLLWLFIGAMCQDSIGQTGIVFNEPCGMNPVREAAEHANPMLQQQRLEQEHRLQQYMASNQRSEWLGDSVITIPVVFHVLYHTDEENIADSLLYSQMQVLNEDFARLNADTILLPDYFLPFSGNPKIQFCFATRDPDGQPTTGITRTYTDKVSFQTSSNTSNYGQLTQMHFTATGGTPIWDRDHYLNIWICNLNSQSGVLAWAYLPGADPAVDGIVCRYNYVGRPTLAGSPYQYGKTLSHEVGHWFNLWHTFDNNDSGDCSDDFVEDTPTQQEANFGCPSFPSPSCDNVSDMYMNYMDYADDQCGKNIFTIGQSDRMRATIQLMRPGLLQSLGCQGTADNDAAITEVYPNVPYCYATIAPVTANLKNNGTVPLTSVVIHHRIDGIEQTPYNWTGNLLPNQTATAILLGTPEMSSGLHVLEVYTTMPNGQNDAFPQNDRYRQVFSIGDGIPTPYQQSFEGNYADEGWTIFDSANAVPWQWVEQAVGSNGQTNACMTIKHEFHDYFNVLNSFDDLFMPVIDLHQLTDATLTFDMSYAFQDDLVDELAIDVSTDCGGSYTTVYNKSGETLSTRSTETPQLATDWRTESVDLSPFVNNNLLVRFRTTTGGGNWLFIDNVNINGTLTAAPSLMPTVHCSVTPNPARDVLTIHLSDKTASHAQLRLSNLAGQTLHTQSVGTATTVRWSIGHLPAGMYFLQYQSDQQNMVQPWIKE